MKYSAFHEMRFRSSLSRVMNNVRSILDSTRQPRLAEDEMHTYDDKYALAEFLTNTCIASQMNALERLGLDPSKIGQVMDWVHTTTTTTNGDNITTSPDTTSTSKKRQQVTLRFVADDSCTFLVEQEVEMDTGLTKEIEVTTNVPSTSGTSALFGSTATKTETVRTRVLTKVKEYHWKVVVSYKIILFPGTNVDDGIVLQKRTTETVIVTAAGTGTAGSAQSNRIMSPLPERTVHPPIDTKLTWFFQMLSPKEQTCQFTIDRQVLDTCKTPRRNNEMKAAEQCNKNLYEWSRKVRTFFLQRVEKEITGKHNPVKKETTGTSNNHQRLPLEPGSTGIMTGLVKEPTFNGQRVRIIMFDAETQRYKAEPYDTESGLPEVLSIKPSNILPDKTSNAVPPGPPLESINDNSILCPILPLMEKGSVLDMGDVGEFLNEQSRALDEYIDTLTKEYPPRQLLKQVSVAEAATVLICTHLESLTTQYLDSIDYIEYMLKTQLIQAIGKEITINDFEQFIRAHNRKLFTSAYKPSPFSYAIRRPGFYPDGIVSIETKVIDQNSSPDPIETFSRKVTNSGSDGLASSSSSSIYIPINAGTSVEIQGDTYLHGWMQHRFNLESESQQTEYNIACRARQFSCFIVMIGSMKGSDTFEATNAIIVQNKDEVLIPLLTNVLPSAKEFKDSIVSLSPEQQAFAKAFRNMQLESSVFGICIVQIKPQLETLLGLPDCSLTKEIQLTQDLMSLFIDYQIPSDLLALTTVPVVESTTETSVQSTTSSIEKVNAVRGYVKAVMDVIDSSKEKMLKEEEMKHDMRAEMMHSVGCDDAASESFGSAVFVEPQSLEMNMMMRRGDQGNIERRRLQMSSLMMNARGSSLPGVSYAAPVPTCAPAAATMKLMQKSSPRTKKVAERSSYQPSSSASLASADISPYESQYVGDLSSSTSSSLTKTTATTPSIEEDFTLLPKLLDVQLEKHDTEGALRSTIVKASTTDWIRKRQMNLLVSPEQSKLLSSDIDNEKKKAFDLLDAISRSGTLPIKCSELHVIVSVSHCFDNTVMGSIIQDNTNPIEKVDYSSILLATVINSGCVSTLSTLLQKPEDVQRLNGTFPLLLTEST